MKKKGKIIYFLKNWFKIIQIIIIIINIMTRKKCSEPDCKSSAIGKSDKCIAHGGGKRCNEPDCKASA